MERSKECGDKKRCIREINPDVYPGVFFGEAWKYEENFLGCYLCRMNDKEMCEECGQPMADHDDGECPKKIRED